MTTTPGLPHRPPAGSDPSPVPHPTRPSAKVHEAMNARDALAAALTAAGIQLPAMDVRAPWLDGRSGEPPYALVQLGVCAAPVARALAEVITRGAAR
ncbi:hypothetical protein MTQ01_15835 [Streptomyces sp. XM4193]|uniref:hypothetical protein n=1 Tax=Streptomyces sp. XM4193 TaxID=2929782 RepID=UPI001FF87484|nr:hypothetical protein [Streptomyces sp. XM4193]MCK1797467.1 hypothetical protein [Streptomyces sp. XM4193]